MHLIFLTFFAEPMGQFPPAGILFLPLLLVFCFNCFIQCYTSELLQKHSETSIILGSEDLLPSENISFQVTVTCGQQQNNLAQKHSLWKQDLIWLLCICLASALSGDVCKHVCDAPLTVGVLICEELALTPNIMHGSISTEPHHVMNR